MKDSYYWQNRERILERMRTHYAMHKEEIQLRRKPKAKAISRKYHESIKGRFNVAKYKAEAKGVPWSLSFEHYSDLISLPCHYCGGPLQKTGSGLDRKINPVGYTPFNVVPCCRNCNIMKNSFLTHPEMVVAMGAVTALRRARSYEDTSQK